jgi:hypothetical protein
MESASEDPQALPSRRWPPALVVLLAVLLGVQGIVGVVTWVANPGWINLNVLCLPLAWGLLRLSDRARVLTLLYSWIVVVPGLVGLVLFLLGVPGLTYEGSAASSGTGMAVGLLLYATSVLTLVTWILMRPVTKHAFRKRNFA